MKLFKAISSGTRRTLTASRQIIIIWLITITMISILVVPFRNLVIEEIGSGMTPEMLKHGIDISFFLSFGHSMNGLLSSFSVGLVLLIGVGFLTFVFLNGGLFDNLRVSTTSYSVRDFFSASARLFFPFLWVNILVILIIVASALLLIGAPVAILNIAGAEEAKIQLVIKIARILFFVILITYLLVVDYARAWLAASEKRNVFKAVGYGFKATYSSFVSSMIFMIFAVALQALLTWGGTKLIVGFDPASGGGLFILFLMSQVFIILRLFFRAYRYAGVTSLYALG